MVLLFCFNDFFFSEINNNNYVIIRREKDPNKPEEIEGEFAYECVWLIFLIYFYIQNMFQIF